MENKKHEWSTKYMNKRMELQPCQMFGNINKVIMSVQRSLKYFCYFMS